MEGLTPEAMSKQAQQIWSMLDDMADNDPAAYRKFIERQMKDGKEHMAPPDPHMCIQVTLLTKPAKPLFINFCSWKRVPEPKSPEDAVPVSGTVITEEKDEKGTFSLVSVAFNPKVLEEYGRNTKNPVDGDTLVQLALDYIEHEQKVKVTRSYTVLPIDTPHKGDLNAVRLSFSRMLKKQDQNFEKDMSELEKTFGPLTTTERDSLMSKLSNITAEDTGSPTKGIHTQSNASEQSGITLSTSAKKPVKKGLIEEIKDSKPPTPKYSLEPFDSDKGRQLILKVQLPGVKSVSECELDISEDDIKLVVPGQYELKLKLPSCIDDEEASAKFSKKLSLLTLTMPVKT